MSSDVEALVSLLADHEARWTTHGDVRLYDVMHCTARCDWRLRQKALMSDEDCYEAHRRHVAEVILAADQPTRHHTVADTLAAEDRVRAEDGHIGGRL